jgi:tetratricopeptide (TPR) repeat protein
MPLAPVNTANALFGHARRAAAAGRKDGAVAVARAAAQVMPGWISTLMLAELLSSAGCTVEARAELAPLVAQDRGGVTAALVNIALREGRLEEAVALLQHHLAAYPGQRHLHYTLASLLPHLGRFDEANRHAARGTLVMCGDLQFTSSRVIRFPESPPATPIAQPFDRRVWHEPPLAAAGAEAIYVIGCDSRYFLLFGEALATSLARRSGASLALHVHLVNPDQAAEALLERLRKKQALLPILCSRENVELSTLGERQRRTYLSCARYLILPELLERYGRPMLVADADQLVVGDLRALLRELGEHDVGLLRDDRQIDNIVALISASVLGVNYSPNGRRFVRTLYETVVGRMADPAGLSWHLDQAGLAVAHLWHSEIKTLRLPMWIMDSVIDPTAASDTLSPRALFWSITMTYLHTAGKMQTSLFRQFLDLEPGLPRENHQLLASQ